MFDLNSEYKQLNLTTILNHRKIDKLGLISDFCNTTDFFPSAQSLPKGSIEWTFNCVLIRVFNQF